MASQQASPLAYRWQRTLSHLRTALQREGRTLWASLRDPLLGALLLLTLLLAALAFQADAPFVITVGQQPPDLVYLDGLYPPEESGGKTFRWTQGETTLRIPGLGQAPYRLDLTLSAWRPARRQPARLRLEAGGHVLLETNVDPDVRVYILLLPPETLRGGNLDLLLHSDAFVPAYLFGLAPAFSGELDTGELSAGLREQFQQNGIDLTPQATVEVERAGSNWTLVDGDARYFVRSEDQALNVYSTGDSRSLGVLLQQVEVRPAGRPVLPSPEVLLWSALAVLLVVLLARRLGWSRWVALAAGAATALALAAVLAWARPLLTPALPLLPLGLFCAWAAVLLFQGALRAIFSWGGAEIGPRAERWLWSVVAFFLVVRFVGLCHPALETFDLCFHLHRLEWNVAPGNLLFTITSGEWRSLDTLYLPSPYLVLAPFWAVFDGRLVPFKVLMLLQDTSSALLVAYIARRLLGRGWAVPLSGFLYLTMVQSYAILSWGILANIFGQWVFLLLLALVVSPAGRLERPRSWLAAAGLLLAVMLSHPGTVLLAAALLAALMVTVLLAPLSRQLHRQSVWRWVLAALLALVLAVGLYYSYFARTMWEALQQMGQGANAEQAPHGGFLVRGPPSGGLGPEPVEVFSLGQGLVAGAQELAAEAQAYYYTGPLLLAAAAPVGLILQRRRLAVRVLGLAFWIALGFAVLGLVLNLYVRSMYFLLPFIAVGLAWWLGKLSRCGWAGRALGTLAGLALLLAGLAFWVQRVLYFGAGCR